MGVEEVFDAAIHVLVVLGIAGLLHDDSGGLQAYADVVGVEGVVYGIDGLQGYGLKLGLREAQGLFAQSLEALAEVLVFEPAVEGVSGDAGVPGLFSYGAGPQQMRQGQNLPLGEVLGEI